MSEGNLLIEIRKEECNRRFDTQRIVADGLNSIRLSCLDASYVSGATQEHRVVYKPRGTGKLGAEDLVETPENSSCMGR
jgi:hypothetical protein